MADPPPSVFRVLGPVEVWHEGAPVHLGGRQQRALLADLLLHANLVRPVDAIVEDVWGWDPPRSAATTLKVYVSHLRKLLAVTGATITARRPGYVLTVDPLAIDATRFERDAGTAAARTALDPLGAAAPAAAALALWRGTPYEELADADAARPVVARFEALRLDARLAHARAASVSGDHAAAIGALAELVEESPLDERARAALASARWAAGDAAAALRTIDDGADLLRRELGAEAGPALTALRAQIAAGAAPPARSPAGLPRVATTFVGRAADLDALCDTVATSPVTTVVGPGGAGKTRLALEAAARLGAVATRGPWLAELAAAPDRTAVVQSVLDAVGGSCAPGQDPLAAAIAAIGEGPGLLVVDNCEHVVAAAADVVAALVTKRPALRVLATSRETLRAPGETVWPIPPLPAPPAGTQATAEAMLAYDSCRLLLDRASAADASFVAGPADWAAFGELARRLDGLPLALELAVAGLRTLSPADAARRLDDRFRLLDAGPRPGSERHRTLANAVAWSYDLLEPDERTLFERLSVFHAAFGAADAEAVCSGDGIDASRVLGLLRSLVDKSMVASLQRGERGGGARLRLLESLRVFAAERLAASGGAEAGETRLAAWAQQRVAEARPHLRSAAAPEWLAALDDARDDIHASLDAMLARGDVVGHARTAAAMAPYWSHRYLVAYGRPQLELALRSFSGLADPPADAVVDLATGAAYLAWMEDDLDAAVARAEAGLAAAEGLAGDARMAARAPLLTVLGEVARHRGGMASAEAAAWCEQGRRAALAAGDEWSAADAERVLALLALDAGDADEAEHLSRSCLDRWTSAGDAERSAGARLMLANLARLRGDAGAAVALLEQSWRGFEEVGEPWGAAQAVRSLGSAVLAAGDAVTARRHGLDALERNRALSNRRGVAESMLLIAEAALALGDTDGAVIASLGALNHFRERSFLADLVPALCLAARAHAEAGEWEEAAALADEALAADPDRMRPADRETALSVRRLAAEHAPAVPDIDLTEDVASQRAGRAG